MPDAVAARTRLRADCTRCAGLCCVAPAFAASADFAIDKPAGHACPNLRDDDRCGIHAQLRERRRNFGRRLEAIERIQQAASGLDDRIVEIGAQEGVIDELDAKLTELTDHLVNIQVTGHAPAEPLLHAA